jgi:hypothetical protein
MMCQTEIVVSPSLAKVSIGALAVTAWLIFSIGMPGSLLDEVCAHTTNARIVIRAWSTCGERAYRSSKSWRRGDADCRISCDWTHLISSEWDHPISG